MLSRDCVTSPISVAHRIRHPTFQSLKPASRRVQQLLLRSFHRREYLPVGFEFKLMGVQPVLHDDAEFPQLPFVRAEHRDIVHIARIVLTQTALTNQLVEGLQGRVGEPLRRVRANEDAILNDAPNQVEDAPVFEKLPHPVHNDLRLQTFVEMMDVAAELVLRTFRIVRHPILDSLTLLMRASASDAPAAVKIHAAHHLGLQNLDERVMDILVRPLSRFADGAPFLCAGVPTPRNVRFFWLKAFDDDFP